MLTKTRLAQSTPEAQGIASESILAFIDGAEQANIELHSLIVVRHGHQVAQGWWAPYAAELPHMLFSLSKSFTSTAVGMAVAEGRLSVKDRVIDFFPDDLPEQIDENLAVMTVHHLLSMNTGHDKDVTALLQDYEGDNWVQLFLSAPVEHQPGTHFVYNTLATYMCSAIVQKVTGQTLLEYLTPRLFEPLGIEGATWQNCPRGINVGGWGLAIKTADIANFGQLYLQKGQWQGQQLITPEWVEAATSKQSKNASDNVDWRLGYGYQFWRCQHNAYRGDGAFGQYCVVMPDQDAVIAITSGLPNMQVVMDLIWKHLLPAMQEDSLPANPKAHAALTDRLASLQLRTASGESTSPTAKKVSGQRYLFDASQDNEDKVSSIKIDFDAQGAHLTIEDERGAHTIPLGYQTWRAGETLFDQMPWSNEMMRTAASGAWSAPDTFTVRLSFNETPFIPTLDFHFVEDRLEYRRTQNVGFGPPEALQRPLLVGKRG